MTTKAETTKRALYDCLDRIRRAGKHRVLTAEFEERLEEHFEELRTARIEFTGKSDREIQSLTSRLAVMTEERDQIQQRLQAVDHSFFEQSQRNGEQARQIEKLEEVSRIAGEELIHAQETARNALDDASKARNQLSDAMVLVRRQRAAIGHLYMLAACNKQKVMGSEKESACKYCRDTGFITLGNCSSWCFCEIGKLAWSNS